VGQPADAETEHETSEKGGAANPGKLAALDQLAQVFLALTQQYVTLFCLDELPNSFRAPCFLTPLSERWHRVAIQQAAGIAKSWRTNRANAYEDYLDALAEYQEPKADGTLEEGAKEPEFHEWNVPCLRQLCIQANSNVVKLEEAEAGAFDCWLKVSTLDKGTPLLVPIRFSDYHKEQLTDPQTGKRRKMNSSVTLNKRDGVWWLTLSYDETVAVQTRTPPRILQVACQNRQKIKALLLKRHEQWKQNFSLVVVQAPVQLCLWASSETSTDVG
jgi:hypothetical protein